MDNPQGPREASAHPPATPRPPGLPTPRRPPSKLSPRGAGAFLGGSCAARRPPRAHVLRLPITARLSPLRRDKSTPLRRTGQLINARLASHLVGVHATPRRPRHRSDRTLDRSASFAPLTSARPVVCSRARILPVRSPLRALPPPSRRRALVYDARLRIAARFCCRSSLPRRVVRAVVPASHSGTLVRTRRRYDTRLAAGAPVAPPPPKTRGRVPPWRGDPHPTPKLQHTALAQPRSGKNRSALFSAAANARSAGAAGDCGLKLRL